MGTIKVSKRDLRPNLVSEVMPFGLTTSSTFMCLMNHALRNFFGKFVVIYFDDILICSLNMHDHIEHLKSVLNVLLCI